MEGFVKFFNTEKFYGFISNEAGDFFFHGSALVGDVAKGDRVNFELTDGHRGRICAINVQRTTG
jgi:cold shock CspA family protein